jgi:DNA-binding transcriptional LysR family regulator
MSLTLAQIRAFDSIVRLGSFQAAARELGLTQPSVSQRIRELEATLGTALFIRHGPRVSLTTEGYALVDHARRLLDDTASVVARFRERDPLRGLLRLGLNESFALICLPDLLLRLEAEYPNLKTAIHVGDTAEVSRLLNERRLDVGIVSLPDLEPHVRAQPIGTNQLGWFAGRGMKTGGRPLSPVALSRYHLIIGPQSARIYTTAMSWFAQTGAMPPLVSMCNSMPVTIRIILAGRAIGLVPVRLMQDHLAGKDARQVAVTPAMGGHRVSLCYQASEFGPKLQQVLDVVRSVIAERRVFT